MSVPKSVKLKAIDIKNFKSFREASLSFQNDGLVALNAKNSDTGGSSGSGKSNLNNAIAYALGFSSAPATTLQNWSTEEPMQVVLTLDTPNGEVVVSKGHKNSVKIGNRTVTGAKAIEEELRQIFGVDPDTLKALVYRPQKAPGLFLSMDDGDRKEFLGKVLGLDQYESAIEQTKKALTAANNSLSVANESYEVHKRMVDNYPVKQPPLLSELALDELRDMADAKDAEAQSALDESLQAQATIDKYTAAYGQKKKTIGDQSAEQIAKLQEQIDSYWSGYEYVPDMTEINACKAKLDAIQPRLVRAKEVYDSEMRNYRVKSQELNQAIAKCSTASKQVPLLQKKLTEVEHQIETLKGGVCYVCKRDGFYEKHSLETCVNEAALLRTQIEQFSQAAIELKGYEAQLVDLKEPSSDMYNKLNAAQAAEQSKLTTLTAALKTQEEQAKKQYAAGCEDLQNQLRVIKAEAQTKLSELNSKFQTALATVKEKKSQFDAQTTLAQAEAKAKRAEASNLIKQDAEAQRVFAGFRDIQTQMESAEKNLADSKSKVEIETKLSELLKGFIGSIFEEILQEVADETNRILATIPNVSHCSIEFNTESVTQKGTVKQKITPMVTVNGHTSPIKLAVSGGMETAIELAVDIALSNVIARRTGASPQWLILDEAFDGFDAPAKEACLEMLQTHARDKLVIVVSHVAEFKEFFNASIWVEYENGTSRIADA
jgi:DNA repair exonuclease SbcCD ATPase subunit